MGTPTPPPAHRREECVLHRWSMDYAQLTELPIKLKHSGSASRQHPSVSAAAASDATFAKFASWSAVDVSCACVSERDVRGVVGEGGVR
jgi:hypothetical protein